MRRPWRVWVTLVCVLGVASCSDEEAPTGAQDDGGSISGVVACGDCAGLSLMGVEVALAGTSVSAFTDSAGAFLLEGLSAGRYTLVATKGDYEAQSAPVEVEAGKVLDAGALELALGSLEEGQSEGPRVVWTCPAEGQVGGFSAFPLPGYGTGPPEQLPPGAGLQVQFDRVMDAASVEGAMALREAGSADPVAWDLVRQGGDLFALFPRVSFRVGKDYLLEIGAGARDQEGRSLATPRIIHFRPEPFFEVEECLVVAGTSVGLPAGGSAIKLRFNAPLDLESVQAALSITPHVDLTGISREPAYTLLLSPPYGVALQGDTEYTLAIGTQARDAEGNHLAQPYSYAFTPTAAQGLIYALSPYVYVLQPSVSIIGYNLMLSGESMAVAAGDPVVRLVGELAPVDGYLGTQMENLALDTLAIVEIRVNEGDALRVPIQKNRFSVRLTLEPGRNEIRVVVEGVRGAAQAVVGQEASYTMVYAPEDDTARVRITLSWGADFVESPDLDLHLIGPDGADCYYGDPHPDWGVPGAQGDDPFLIEPAGTYTSTGYSMTETVAIPDPAPGTYQVKVHYYDALGDTAKASPQVNLTIDGVSKYYTMPTGQKLGEDEVWDAASFTIATGKAVGRAGAGYAAALPIARAALPPKGR